MTNSCAKEWEVANWKQCCPGLLWLDWSIKLSPDPDWPVCYDPNKWYPICDYPEHVRYGHQWPFHEAPFLIYPDGSGVSSDPNSLWQYQCIPTDFRIEDFYIVPNQ